MSEGHPQKNKFASRADLPPVHPAWRALDFFAGALVHGFLLAFFEPTIGGAAWLGATLAAGAVCANGDRIRAALGGRVVRALIAVYAALVVAATAAAWLRVGSYDSWIAGLLGLFALWTAALLLLRLDPLLGAFAAPVLAAVGFLAAHGRFAPLAPAEALIGAGLTIMLLAVCAGRLPSIGRWFFGLFCVAAATAGAGDIYAHGVDFTGEKWLNSPGVHPLLTWAHGPQLFKNTFGLDLHFAQADPLGRPLLGSGKGLFLLDPHEVRQLAVGPAEDGAAVDLQNKHVYVAARDRVLNRLDGRELQVVRQRFLPRPVCATRFAAEGVYALDCHGRLRLYDAELQAEVAHWDDALSDVAPDGESGFYATTVAGQLLHHRSGAARPQAAPLRRWGGAHPLALDRVAGRLFAGNSWSRHVQVFDAAGLRLLTTLNVGRGVRELVWSETNRTLLVGLYAAGDIVAFSGPSLREIGRLNLGGHLCSLTVDENNGRALAVTAAGVFAFDPEIVFPDVEKRRVAPVPAEPPPEFVPAESAP